jgi:transcriptional regulator with XRE-family HTH domain
MNRLKEYLQEQAMTQAELARRVGVTQPTVWGWLSGDSLPSAETLKKLATATGLSIDALLDQQSRKRVS